MVGIFARLTYSSRPEHVKPEGSTNAVPVQEWVLQSCPSLSAPFTPSWFIPSFISGLAHTVFCLAGKFDSYKVNYQRHLLSLGDGGTIGIDIQPAVEAESDGADMPLVVVLHGLSGGSDEAYVRSLVHDLVSKSFRCAVVNFRGCGGVPLTSAQLYSGGSTDDVRTATAYLRRLFPKSSMSAVGYSLGANVLVKYLTEEGIKTPVSAACVIGSPWNMTLGSSIIESKPGRIISRVLAANLKKLVLQMNETCNLDQYHTADQRERFARLKQFQFPPPTLKDFDDLITCKMGGPPPVWPMKDADEYYATASSSANLKRLKTPVLSISAEDDPVCAIESAPDRETSGWLVQCLSEQGGHLGFFEGGSAVSWFGFGQTPERWYERPLVEFMMAARNLPVRDGKLSEKDWDSVRMFMIEMK